MLEKTFYKTLLSRSFKNVPVKVVFWDHSTATYGDLCHDRLLEQIY